MQTIQMDKINQKINQLYSYSYFLPEYNKVELINDVDQIKEDIKNNAISIEKINGLYIYSYFLPENNKAELIDEVDKIKNVFKKNKKQMSELQNQDEPLKEDNTIHEPPPPPPLPAEEIKENIKDTGIIEFSKDTSIIEFSSEFKAPEINEKKDTSRLFIKPAEVKQEQSLYVITKILVPNLTDKGRVSMESRNITENILSVLELINDKSSIADLYNLYSYKYDNYLEFLNIIYLMETDELIKFIKIENLDPKAAWVRFGQILVECNVVHQVNLINSLNYKKTNLGMLTGEALLDLRFITKDILDEVIKIQLWFDRLFKNSVYIEGIIKTEGLITNAESVSNIFEFIIPEITPEGKQNILKLNNENLANMLNILNGESTLLAVYENNKESFKNDKLIFLKLMQKLDSLQLLAFKKNENVRERSAEIRFGELAINLGLANEEQIEDTFLYRQDHPDKKLLIGETLVELQHLSQENLENCLSLQKWCNNLLARVSYENAFTTAVKEVIQYFFKLPVDIGKFIKKEFNRPLLNMICIIYTFSGELNGQVYYFFDRNFVEELAKILLASYGMNVPGMDTVDLDKSIIAELCNMITGNSITKLSKAGIFCNAGLPEILMEPEIVLGVDKPISILPLTNQYGRFIVGFNLDNK
jgi:CheY-specific phosphatase CheX